MVACVGLQRLPPAHARAVGACVSGQVEVVVLGGGVVGAVVEHVQSVPCDACAERAVKNIL